MEEESVDVRRNPLRRWLLAAGVLCLVAAVAFLALAFAPLKSSNFGPAWLRELPSVVDNNSTSTVTYYLPGGRSRKGEEYLTGERVQMVRMPFEEFVDKMNQDLTRANGWSFARAKGGQGCNWSKTEGNNNFDVWALVQGASLRVTTSYHCEMTWADRSQRWIKRVFGL